jgi:UDPglucose 6-dehydrogenase
MVAAFASRGCTVWAHDSNPELMLNLHHNKFPTKEPKLKETLNNNYHNIMFSDSLDIAIAHSSITFIIVPTPSEADGRFSCKYVLLAIEEIRKALLQKDEYHLIVLTSTVMPGDSDKYVIPELAELPNVGYCYSPEFIAIGSVIKDLLHPDFVLIGSYDGKAARALHAFYDNVCYGNPKAAIMNPLEAEITKLSVNAFVTTKISFANTLARICERFDHADVEKVTSALGLDSRIGSKYLRGTVRFGGPCFPRDNRAFQKMASELQVKAHLAEATDTLNAEQTVYLAQSIINVADKVNDQIGILGLTYKTDCDIIEESAGYELLKLLLELGYNVKAFDPMGVDNAARMLNRRDCFYESAADCLEYADIVVIPTAWPIFKTTYEGMEHKPRVLIDCWNLLGEE